MPSVAALPAVADAVAGRAEVLLDGGIRRGTDVLKALALGPTRCSSAARACTAWRSPGSAASNTCLTILREEIARGLTLLGVRDIQDLDRSHVRPATSDDQNTVSIEAITTQ